MHSGRSHRSGGLRHAKGWCVALGFLCLTPIVLFADGLPPAIEREVDFKTDVAPLLKRCHACHGETQQLNGLRLDRKEDALRGGDSGRSIVPGNSAESRLIHLVAGYRVKSVMPPTGERLTRKEIGILRAWIDHGAEWPEPNTESKE